MGFLVWVTVALAFWHFAIFIPDRFWGGIVGSFVLSLLGGVISGFLLAGAAVPTNDELSLGTALAAVPGALLGMGLAYGIGVRRGNAALHV
jgi:membrane protein DedA with SNARE-associated domain